MNVANRLTIAVDGGGVDVERASDGRFSSDVQAIYRRWDEFLRWSKEAKLPAGQPFDVKTLGAPAPLPPQVFAIGLNYTDHASEAGLELPEKPMVFTKFPASVTGPYADIVLPRGSVDYEVELVAIVGERAENVRASDAWRYVAGLTVGQDLSERELQLSGPPPQQFSLAKSFTGFAPLGPVLVTLEELENADDLELGCSIDGETLQEARTSSMIFSVPEIVAFLSSVLPLLPGDAIFTGTPSGIGWVRNPRRLLGPKDELVTWVKGIGEMRHHFKEGAHG